MPSALPLSVDVLPQWLPLHLCLHVFGPDLPVCVWEEEPSVLEPSRVVRVALTSAWLLHVLDGVVLVPVMLVAVLSLQGPCGSQPLPRVLPPSFLRETLLKLLGPCSRSLVRA